MVIGARTLQGMSGHDAGRQLLSDMYRELTEETLPQIAVTDRGKPYFVAGKLHFSISHTKEQVFCVLSESIVGIDAEETDRDMDLRLADKILSPTEKERYESAPDKRIALLRFWVLPEHYWNVKLDMTEALKLAMDEAGIEIPFNQLDVRIKQEL